ncbi:TerC family protein [Anaeromyxobacter dehalogenans]|uniref:Integral membrane protein TerC n=1 Tax=Anaeromyxobacter dehalogenans (strain 2CP-C) TaxID=290397 RepID=Q2IJF7_ANADE|nr:TerC family protein [Anaeromyxobacter dehalogenans]ABC81786.1 Integral membrane protein TerC [Anaeromyxobacter dehalogenans 2CP-C]
MHPPALALETVGNPWLWLGFLVLVLVLLALDLGVFHRRDEVIRAREALGWTAVWAALAAVFAGFVWWRFGANKAIEFVTGYLIEQSLSVDNLFVFVLVFATFAIPPKLQHRVLFWGITTAFVLRLVMIVGGTALLTRFHWLIYVFGAFLVVTGIRIFFHEEQEHHPEKSVAFRVLRRLVPSTSRMEGHHFFLVENGRRVATPLFLALCMIEVSDVVFALDSVPAIFGITLDPFIVFTSNIFAIMGLRSLYFAVAQLLRRFEYLKAGLALVLVFIGLKMVVSSWVHVNAFASLGVVVALLGGAMGYSLWRTRREEAGSPEA